MPTTITTVTDTEWPRIYDLFDRAMANEIAEKNGSPMPADEPGLEDAIDMVGELYGVDALRQLLTGRSPRA